MFLSVVIVVGVLCLAMGLRAGAIIGAVLFLTVLGTLFVMWLAGIELERISLGALIIAMGMLVDNAVVVCDGMLIQQRRGQSILQAAQQTLRQTQWALLGSTIIGILAFAGIGLSQDTTGEFLFSLFFVIAVSLLLSSAGAAGGPAVRSLPARVAPARQRQGTRRALPRPALRPLPPAGAGRAAARLADGRNIKKKRKKK